MLLATLRVTLSLILLVYVPGHCELTSTIGGASFSLAQTSGNLAAVVVRFLVETPGGTAPKLTFVTGSAALFSVASGGLQRGKTFDRLCTAKDFSRFVCVVSWWPPLHIKLRYWECCSFFWEGSEAPESVALR